MYEHIASLMYLISYYSRYYLLCVEMTERVSALSAVKSANVRTCCYL